MYELRHHLAYLARTKISSEDALFFLTKRNAINISASNYIIIVRQENTLYSHRYMNSAFYKDTVKIVCSKTYAYSTL